MKQISLNVSYNASINLLVKTFAIKISPFRASLFPYFVEVRVRAHKYIGDATRCAHLCAHARQPLPLCGSARHGSRNKPHKQAINGYRVC